MIANLKRLIGRLGDGDHPPRVELDGDPTPFCRVTASSVAALLSPPITAPTAAPTAPTALPLLPPTVLPATPPTTAPTPAPNAMPLRA